MLPPTPGLLAFDVDGTVLNHRSELTDRTVAALIAASDAGWRLVVSTGRPPRLVPQLVNALGDKLTHGVMVNGSVVIELPSRKVLRSVSMTRDVADDAIRRVRAAVPGIGFAKVTDRGFAYETGLLGRLPHSQPLAPPVLDVIDFDGDPVTKLLVFHEIHGALALLEQIAPLLDDTLEVSHLGAEAVEVGPTGISKATGLAWLGTQLGFTAADVIAIGDNHNDIEMLRWAGHGVAMGNSEPDVLAIADEVIGHNSADGLAIFVEGLLSR